MRVFMFYAHHPLILFSLSWSTFKKLCNLKTGKNTPRKTSSRREFVPISSFQTVDRRKEENGLHFLNEQKHQQITGWRHHFLVSNIKLQKSFPLKNGQKLHSLSQWRTQKFVMGIWFLRIRMPNARWWEGV